MKPWIIAFFLSIFLTNEESIRAKYATLSPKSLTQNFAFYELYPDTPEGKKALKRAWQLITKTNISEKSLPLLSQESLKTLLKAINRENSAKLIFSEEELCFIEKLASHLQNRKLLGHNVWDLTKIRALAKEQIDLARAVFLEEYEEKATIRSYEALLDIMALQVLSQLEENPKPEKIIASINHLLFHELGFRFPPASAWEQQIDIYTQLPSVIDAKKGVCLGVCILYLSLAQRLGLKLQPVTPPGHIFVRYIKENQDPINIETTARGIHLCCKHYQGLTTPVLETKNLLEVVGLVFINQASVAWRKKEYENAITLYKKALIYLPEYALLWDLLAYNYLFAKKIPEGNTCLEKACRLREEQGLAPNSISQDYLTKNASIEAIATIFTPFDDTKKAILEKRAQLEKVLEKNPRFQAGLLHYAQTFLQLGKEKQAIAPLYKLYTIQKTPIEASYYLARIYLKRYDYKRSWLCLHTLQSLFSSKAVPEIVKELERSLTQLCPKPASLHTTKALNAP